MYADGRKTDFVSLDEIYKSRRISSRRGATETEKESNRERKRDRQTARHRDRETERQKEKKKKKERGSNHLAIAKLEKFYRIE